MSEGVVKFKGSRSGLQLVLDEAADFSAIEDEIKDKLESGSNFFCKGTMIQVVSESLSEDEKRRLSGLFHAHGVVMRAVTAAELDSLPAEPEVPDTEEKAVPEPAVKGQSVQEMTVVNRTVRGGEEITSKSSVLICGNVNPGAQIIAGGSIDIRGTCRGIVHAGAYGDTSAFVIADHLMPMQVRIAGMIARAPDHVEKSAQAERASIKNGQIIIEPIER
jgi:septum site-determining protein MinC